MRNLFLVFFASMFIFCGASYGLEKKEFDLLTKEAEGGSAEAQLKLGNGNFYEEYVAQDGYVKFQLSKKDAFKWFELAAKQGNMEAQKMVSEYYRYGRDGGPKKDLAEAIKWQRLAIKNGDSKYGPKILKELEQIFNFEPGLLAMEKSRFLACDAFIVNVRAQTIFFDGTYNEPLLMKELRLYKSIKDKRGITEQETSIAGGKLHKELKEKYGSDTFKKLEYLDQKTIECGGVSKRINPPKK